MFGLLAAAAVPAALAISDRTGRFSLLESGFAAAPAALLGLLAVVLGRRGRRRQRAALGRVSGARAARVGRVLGWVGLYVAATAGVALGVYWLETYLSE